MYTKKSRIKVFQLEKNVGAASARNISLDYAKEQFIVFLDRDDLWIPTKLKNQIDRRKEIDFYLLIPITR